MELEDSLKLFDPAAPVPPGVASVFNALLSLCREQKPADPVVRAVDRIHADLVEQYRDDAPAVRDVATVRVQLVQLQMAVEDPEEYDPPNYTQIMFPTSVFLKAMAKEHQAALEENARRDRDEPESSGGD